MIGQVYNWKRLWYPRGAEIGLSPGGYPYYPDSILGSIINPGVVPFESIADVPCLILLGEPGIGKSYAMRMAKDAISTEVEGEGDELLWLDLHSYGDEGRLVRDLFESDVFVTWLEGKHRLHLFVDSLDECLLRVDTVAEILGDELVRYRDAIQRLRLRLACRTADWPLGLEYSLDQLWGEDAVGVYELAPLREEDVVEAVRANGLSADVFLAEIDRMDLAPLAIKPVTLDFLIATYKRRGRFPSSQTELYEQGCRLLCEETNEGRRGAKLMGALTAEERMAVASRIAAVTTFANKAAVWVDVDRGNVPEHDIVIRTLAGGIESCDGIQLLVTGAAVQETLSTGLFSSRGPRRMGWAHQTYAEFLAARYLGKHDLTVSQMMSLVSAPGDLEQKVVPQLHETAAWLAGMVPDVFRTITSRDPLVLLRSDVATVDIKDRRALVDELLELYEKEELLDRDLQIRRYYGRLAHAGLADQLRPYIVDATKGVLVRRVATDIAETCELTALQDDLVQIILDPLQPRSIRVNAAYAVYRIGDDAAKGKLKPLAMEQAGSDPDDELKGCGLLATWPDHLTAEELFAVLRPPKQENFAGFYSLFLSPSLVDDLQPSDLPVALEWVERQPRHHELSFSFSRLLDAVILKAWDNLDAPDVLDACARAVLSRLRRFDGIAAPYLRDSPLKERLKNDVQKRHMLVEALASMFVDAEREPPLLIYSEVPLVTGRDLLWMFGRFQQAGSEQTRAVWKVLIEGVFYQCEPDQSGDVLTAIDQIPVLSEAFGEFVKPVDLNSPFAQKMRERAQTHRQREEQLNNRPVLEILPSERISELLDECESGNPSVWWQLNRVMKFREDGSGYFDEREPDLMAFPGWETAKDETRTRIIETAKHYVLHGEPETSTWLGTHIIYHPALAGYRALLLLLQHDSGFVLALPADIWHKWAPIILAYPKALGVQEDSRRQILIALAYYHASDKVIAALEALVDEQDQGGGPISIVREIESCWDDRIADALLRKVRSATLRPQSMGQLLEDLLKHQSQEARLFAESLVSARPTSDQRKREIATVAACSLVRYTFDESWTVVWPAVQHDAEFGREVFSSVAADAERREGTIARRLSESQLADLYIWLSRQYPHAEDPRHNDWHAIEPRESIAEWRDSLLRHLRERGTPAACETIQRIARELPELDWLKWTLLQAQEVTRRMTWKPPRPEDVLGLAASRETRLVNGGDDLVEVLIEALERLEAKLQGETPAAREIWDRVEQNVYRPVDENDFSDYVKRHLEHDLRRQGIILNREVEIRRATGGEPGERTDILVDAVIPASDGGEYDAITAIIEVKGCWHSELETAMETQLVDRYLKDNQCRHGIYLVGWFNCDQWNDQDSRKQKTPKKTIAEMQEQFDRQAAELSKRGVRIRAFVMNTALR